MVVHMLVSAQRTTLARASDYSPSLPETQERGSGRACRVGVVTFTTALVGGGEISYLSAARSLPPPLSPWRLLNPSGCRLSDGRWRGCRYTCCYRLSAESAHLSVIGPIIAGGSGPPPRNPLWSSRRALLGLPLLPMVYHQFLQALCLAPRRKRDATLSLQFRLRCLL